MAQRQPRRKQKLTAPYYVQKSFRCLTEDQVGLIQHLALDKRMRRASLAEQFGVCESVIYSAIRAVPEFLVQIKKPRLAKVHRITPEKKRRQA